jgi:hypothetical protein
MCFIIEIIKEPVKQNTHVPTHLAEAKQLLRLNQLRKRTAGEETVLSDAPNAVAASTGLSW